jgi:hypothetical protein
MLVVARGLFWDGFALGFAFVFGLVFTFWYYSIANLIVLRSSRYKPFVMSCNTAWSVGYILGSQLIRVSFEHVV